jgi:hypothetical protein
MSLYIPSLSSQRGTGENKQTFFFIAILFFLCGCFETSVELKKNSLSLLLQKQTLHEKFDDKKKEEDKTR